MKIKEIFAPSDMTQGKPWEKILVFTIPMLLGNIAQQLYNTVDSIVVGRYVGDNALAAVGSASPIMNLLLVLFVGISVGAGVMVSQSVAAAELLEKEGIPVRVVNISTIKPLDVAALKECCQGVKGIVTAEEHNVMGGMGSAVCEALCDSRLPVKMVGLQDTFGRSAENYQLLLEKYHLMPEDVAVAVKAVLKA